jgi:hypothetical protein
MRLCIVCDLVTHARFQGKPPAILGFGTKFAFRAQENVTLDTPMIGNVTRRVFHHAYPNASEVSSSPICAPSFALVFRRLELRPVGGSKRDVGHLHEWLLR